jgi:predicted permease
MSITRWLDKLPLKFHSLFHRADADYELNDELRDHIEQTTASNISRGLSPAEARRHAILSLGGIAKRTEECRDARGTRWLEDLAHDVRYALRMLRKDPGFAAIVILTLALGIGATSGVFSVVNSVLLQPLPYAHPEQLVALSESKLNFTSGSIPYPNFKDWQKNNTTFSSMAISRPYSYTLAGTGEPERVQARLVTDDFFTVLGVKPAAGRTFLPGEEQVGAAPLVVISNTLWQRKFGGDPAAVGRSLRLDDRMFTIIGVLPANFALDSRSFSSNVDVFVTVGLWGNPALTYRGAGLYFHGFGRLKPGVTIEQARADLAAVTSALAKEYPDTNKGTGATLVPLTQEVVGDVRSTLLILLGAVGFVLLIACVNVGNLLLARSSVRSREIAIRATLGAGSSRLIRQLLTESVLLALVGGGLGLLIAQWGTRAAIHLLPETLPRASNITVDSHVLLFAFAISVLAGVLFGLAPAFKVAHRDLQRSLKDGGRTSTAGKQRLQGLFVVLEMAMGVVLLAGAGLMIRSLTALWHVNPGFVADNVLSFNLTYPASLAKAPPDQIRQALRDTEARFTSTPGVHAVSVVWGSFPLAEDDQQLFWMPGQPKPATEADMNWATRYFVGPDYLKTMRIPLVAGRFFTASDDNHAPRVVVIDETFAHKYFPNENPVGKRIQMTDPDDQAEIIGVVGHVKQWTLLEDSPSDTAPPLRAEIYLAHVQTEDGVMHLMVPGVDVAVRADGPPDAVLAALRRTSAAMNPEQVISNVETMTDMEGDTIAQPRFAAMMLGGFAAVALLLAMIGVYGVISYSVERRTNEIGIRMALGAERGSVFRLVLGEGMRLALIGAVVGVVAALALTRLMSGLIFGVSAHDPLTFAGVAFVLAAVAALACWIPARRATRVDPIVALRYE